MPPKRTLLTLLLTLAAAIVVQLPTAAASTTQVSIFQAGGGATQATVSLPTIRALGASEIRVFIPWTSIASASKQPTDPANPASYPAANWAQYDDLVKAAKAANITVDFDIGNPAPRWAEASGGPSSPERSGVWKPNAADFGAFVNAVATRYSGHYEGLPRVGNWSIWNEPNYGPSLAPQGSDGGKIVVSADTYRGLVDHAYSAFKATGHGGDTILFGETAPHGYTNGGTSSGTAPLIFLRALYCVSSSFKPLTGSLAKASGCPTTTTASKKFRSQNPILFNAKGFAAHLYAQGQAPNKTLGIRRPCAVIDTADSADLGNVAKLESTLDEANGAYGSHTKLGIYNTEYGFQTDPPEAPSCNVRPVSDALAAEYMNWAEYISYKNSRIRSYDQYLLNDPPPTAGAFDSGLELYSASSPFFGPQKTDVYDAYQIPLYMPTTSSKSADTLEVWGGARPSAFGGAHNVLLQFTPTSGSVHTAAVGLNSKGYFDTHMKFTTSGTLRVVWKDASGQNEFSRSQSVTVG
jgi:hypothetical protein